MADVTFVYKNLAVGGGIFTPLYMQGVADSGITHILDTQAEYDDTPLAEPHGIEVCWCPAYDDFSAPSKETFEYAAKFIDRVLVNGEPNAKLLVHCAGGVHRGPMFGLLACMLFGVDSEEAITRILGTRLIASFPKVYRGAVENFIEKRNKRA